MEIRWITNPSTTPIYAAGELAGGKDFVDKRLAEQLNDPVSTLRNVVRDTGIKEEVFWSYIVPLSPAFQESRKLARMVLYRCLDAEASRSPAVAEMEQALDQLLKRHTEHFPDMETELPLRVGPLREQWESRGPGMLAMIAQLTDPKLIAGKADVMLVQPVGGGGGSVSLTYNSVAFEAVLANPHIHLPETVRLAWMLSQINGDLPMFTEGIPVERVSSLTRLAMLIPTLAAADHVDLVTFSDQLLADAIALWRIESNVDDLPARLTFWWNAYVTSRPPWLTAVQELNRLLSE